MILLGLLLMAGCVALAVDAVVENTHVLTATAFTQPVDHLSLGALFVAGCVVGVLFALGLMMVTGGIGRARRRRLEHRTALRRNAAETQALREHNERLEEELAARDSAGTYPDEPEGERVAADTADRRTLNGGRHRA
jgi:hypothetical protein